MTATASADPVSRDRLRKLIDDFLAERQQAKLDKSGDDPDKQAQIRADHQRENWLADAARRASWIQLATHTLKPLHPSARGSSIYYVPVHGCSDDTLIGTHLLKGDRVDDVVAKTAAALDVYKFLKLELDGATLLQRMLARDPAVPEAFADEPALAQTWVQAFTGIVRGETTLASHTFGKQVYFPVGDDTYHLLAPLFPTSLVQRLHDRLRRDREHGFAMRQARKAAQASVNSTGKSKPAQALVEPGPYREYPDMAVQKFGGNKPQNISQLNSERGGLSHLLPSLPPHWQSDPVRPPYRRRSVLEARGPFASRRSVRELTDKLKHFLVRVVDRNNVQIRNRRAELVDLIVDELVEFAASLHTLPPGWSSHANCDLDAVERRWLDPHAEHDPLLGWDKEVAHRFGNWLNGVLRTDRTPMGDEEHREWEGLVHAALKELREALSDES